MNNPKCSQELGVSRAPGPTGTKRPLPHLSACLAFQERVAGCKLPAGSCSWNALSRELSRKVQLGTQVCAEGLSNHFLPWMYLSVPGHALLSSRDATLVQQDLFTSAAFQLPPTWMCTLDILPNALGMC